MLLDLEVSCSHTAADYVVVLRGKEDNAAVRVDIEGVGDRRHPSVGIYDANFLRSVHERIGCSMSKARQGCDERT